MSDTVTLLHPFNRVPGFVIHSYDGFAVANDGVVTIPADNLTMLETAWRRGFNTSPDGQQLYTSDLFWDEVKRQTAESADAPTQVRTNARTKAR